MNTLIPINPSAARYAQHWAGVVMLLSTVLLAAPAWAACPGTMQQAGDAVDPCQIQTWNDLDEIRNGLDLHYVLMNDLTSSTDGYEVHVANNGVLVNGVGWWPIGANNPTNPFGSPFTGKLDGQDYTIADLRFAGEDYRGLFREIGGGAEIANLRFENPSITLEDRDQAGVLAYNIDFIVTQSKQILVTNVHISGLSVSLSGIVKTVGGLVGSIDNGNIDDAMIVLDTISVSGEIVSADSNGTIGEYIGGIVGRAANIQAADLTSDVQILLLPFVLDGDPRPGAVSDVGGLFGSLENAEVSNSTASGDVQAGPRIGGAVGSIEEVSLNNVHATGDVVNIGIGATEPKSKIRSFIGGLVGRQIGGEIIHSSASGYVQGAQDRVGGLVGYIEQGRIIDSHATGDVNTNANDPSAPFGEKRIGGLVGYALDSEISHSSASGHVAGDRRVGGLVGENKGGQISTSFASGDVLAINADPTESGGGGRAGGLVGWNRKADADDNEPGLRGTPTIENAYATGDVSGPLRAGGLVGDNTQGEIHNAYSAALVAGVTEFGGLVGANSGTVTASFFDKTLNPTMQDEADFGKTTAEMTAFATFDAAWNSATQVIVDGWQAPNNPSWGICKSTNDGYPFLLWQFDSDPCISDPDSVLSIQVVPRPAALRVSWLAPLNDGGSPITRYVARANPSCEVPALANEVPGETLYSCDITGLDPEQTYQVFVTAFTDAGSSEAAALGNDNGGNNGASTPASFAPNPIIVVPVNNPWALLALVLMMLGLVAAGSVPRRAD